LPGFDSPGYLLPKGERALSGTDMTDKLIWPSARIEICGPLGSGKSTLASLLGHYGASTLYEPVAEHPYLERFYTNPVRFALETNLHFVTHYLHTVKVHQPLRTTLVVDSGLPLRRTYHDVCPLTATERLIGDDLMDGVAALIPPADLYIHLVASTHQLMRRIAKRGRDIEASVDMDYVDQLNRRLDVNMAKISPTSRLLTLEVAALEGLTDPVSAQPVIEKIHRALHAALEAGGRIARAEPALPLQLQAAE
jgi:deoxyadenosine/deoxycytidine kinase